jgi:AbrB family looped-hinge helix DNA binding protein
MTSVTLSSKGQMIIPKSIRDQLHLKAGDKIDVYLEGNSHMVVVPIKKSLRDLKGFLPKPDRAVSLKEMDESIAGAGSMR